MNSKICSPETRAAAKKIKIKIKEKNANPNRNEDPNRYLIPS